MTHLEEFRAMKAEVSELRRQVKALQRLVDHPSRWSRDAVIGALRLYAQQHGRAPGADDWHTAAPDRSTPAQHTVIKLFGSWSAAIAAAGLPPNPIGAAVHRNRRVSDPDRASRGHT